jgi:hypothetical protein
MPSARASLVAVERAEIRDTRTPDGHQRAAAIASGMQAVLVIRGVAREV